MAENLEYVLERRPTSPEAPSVIPGTVCVLGAGSYGTAIAYILAQSGHKVLLWCRKPEVCEKINTTHKNPNRFPEKVLPDLIIAEPDLKTAVDQASHIVHCVPAQATSSFLTANKEIFLHERKPIVCTAKGIDAKTGKLMSEVIADVLGEDYPAAFLSGPSFAKEMLADHPMAVTLAAKTKELASDCQSLFDRRRFRTYMTTDVIGCEVGGALKNPLAIGAGMARGRGFGQSSIAGIVTRGIVEMQRLCVAMGGDIRTLQGLCGMGDLMLTCFSSLSRNNRFGHLIGSTNCSLEEAAAEIGEVVEGAATAAVVLRKMKEYNVRMPLFEGVGLVLEGKLTPDQAILKVMDEDVVGRFELE